jgi:hypothetical protein
MYRIEIRLYVTKGKLHCAGEYTRQYAQDQELIRRVYFSRPIEFHSPSDLHHEILTAGVRVCQEIAEVLEQPLL